MNNYDPVETVLVHERFDAFADLVPDRIAIEDAQRTLTYGQARAWAERIASRLKAEGVGPEHVVGIHLQRSVEAVVAIIAALRIGAAYLALPPDYPIERLRFMAEDANARFIVTDDDGLPAGLDEVATALPVDGLPEAGERSAPAQVAPTHLSQLAYVIYTSGTTGLPKGVAVTHGNIANLVSRAQRHMRFASDETFLQLSPLAFDPSAPEIWGALAHGGRLVIASPSYDAIDELPSVLAGKHITTMGLTPALFHSLVEKRPEALDSVRRLLIGGDILSAAKARLFVERAAHRGSGNVLLNVYGPTETTTFVSAQSMDEVAGDVTRVPVGPPIGGARLYLLDEHLNQVAAGEHGEVYIGGIPVTRGYLGRPALTADRFVPDPQSAEPGARMYATGDEGVLDERGVIAVLGRLDDQVKVRGHRVELGELEHVLRRHPDVRDACVVLVDPRGRREQLVAHIATDKDAEGLPELLAKHVAEVLPSYMCPGAYAIHDRLPLTLTGKIDREALVLNGTAAVEATHTDAPAGPDGTTRTEAVLAEIWRKNFESQDIGLDDDFSAVGGTSILAISIVADAQDRGLPLTLTLHFQNPTVRRAAAAMASGA
ncbi:non-ribosomal peptide synthetase [Streptomyces sp. NPDC048290]|uniref:non-ribosomal peptide synthetase n=1 Tax=Streptomyces sp. NPDC048290 TaxID=3155811 RepID=UPI0034228A65